MHEHAERLASLIPNTARGGLILGLTIMSRALALRGITGDVGCAIIREYGDEAAAVLKPYDAQEAVRRVADEQLSFLEFADGEGHA